MINVIVLTEVMSFLATCLLAYPSLRVSAKLLQIKDINKGIQRDGTSAELQKTAELWRTKAQEIVQSWSRLDHWCLRIGIFLVLALTAIRLFDALVRSTPAN